MALKGQIAKEEITKKILETFSGAFQYDKEIRIPWVEDGQQVQIKITLTTAKAIVNMGGDIAIPGATAQSNITLDETKTTNIETSSEEKENLSKLLRSLGL